MTRALYGFHEECSGLSKKQLNVIGEIDVWCLDNVDDRLMSVSNNLEMKKDIEDIKRLGTSFNTNKPSYASKVSELKIINNLMNKHYTFPAQ